MRSAFQRCVDLTNQQQNVWAAFVALSIRDLKTHFTLSRSTVWRYEKAGQFPRAIKISERRKAWRESDIMRWLDERAGKAA